MKIVNEKGKLFGLINVVDLFVILAVLVVIAGVGFKLISAKLEDASQEKVKVTAVVRVRGAQEYLVENLKENDQVGKKMVSGTEYVEGTVESVQFEDFYQQVAAADGSIVNSLDPVKQDVIFTVQAEVEKDPESPITKIGVQEMRVGRNFTVKTDDFEILGVITSVEVSDLPSDMGNNNENES